MGVSGAMVRAFVAAALVLVAGFSNAGENTWTTNGPPGSVTALAVDPTGSWLLAGATLDGRSIGYRGDDHGASWTSIGEAPQGFSISGFAVDPDHSETVSAAATPGAFLGGSTAIFQSRDAGETWLRFATVSAADVFALAYHPTRPSTLFAVGQRWRCFQAPCFPYSTLGRAILRSVDSGATWTDVTGGLPHVRSPVVAVAFDPTDPNRIYAAGGGGVFVSEDGGDHWMLSVSGMEGCSSATALAPDPRNAGAVFAATTWRSTDPYVCGAVFRSADSGRTWAPTSLRGRDVTSLVIDPLDSRTLYAGVATPNPVYPDVGVFRSRDGGATWDQFGPGLPVSGVRALVVETSGRFLHAVTDDGIFDYEIVPGVRPPVTLPNDREPRTLPSRP